MQKLEKYKKLTSKMKNLIPKRKRRQNPPQFLVIIFRSWEINRNPKSIAVLKLKMSRSLQKSAQKHSHVHDTHVCVILCVHKTKKNSYEENSQISRRANKINRHNLSPSLSLSVSHNLSLTLYLSISHNLSLSLYICVCTCKWRLLIDEMYLHCGKICYHNTPLLVTLF